MWRAGRPRTRRALSRSPPPPSSRARRPRKWRPPRRTCWTGGIIGLLLTRVVHVALEPHDEPLGAAVEVHDEAVEDVLTAKLQAKNAPVSQQRPRVALGRGRCATQLPRPGKPLCVREAPERIHGSKLVRGAAPLPTGTACEGAECCATRKDGCRSPFPEGRGGQGVRTCEAARG